MFNKRSCGLALISSALLAGCAFTKQTTGMAVEYNDFVAQTTNRQTLLNVLRASEREPMHFTSFGTVRGTVRGQGNAEVSAGIPSDAVQTIAKTITPEVTPSTTENTVTDTDNLFGPSLKAGLQVSSGTDFDIAVNATDEFYRGILGPLKESVVVHYLRQNFPADLLSHLLIGEIRFHAVFKKGGKEINTDGGVWQPGEEKYGHILVKGIRNTPDENDSARAFEQAINCRDLAYLTDRRDKRGIGFKSLADLSSVAPETLGRVTASITAPQDYTFNISESNDFRLALSEPKECDVIRSELTDRGVELVNALGKKLKIPGDPLQVGALPPAADVTPEESLMSQRNPALWDSQSDASPSEAMSGRGTFEFGSKDFFTKLLRARGFSKEYSGELVVEVTLRSVEGVLYYLGEYIRKPHVSPKLYGKDCQGLPQPCIPILVVKPRGSLAGEPFVEVSYRRRRYVAPLSGREILPAAGRSSQTISLVQQLLNLHRSSKDLPVTPVVRVAN